MRRGSFDHNVESMTDFIPRVGSFFIVIGFGLFILFIASDSADMPEFDYLCLSIVSIGLGLIMLRRRPPPASAGRFSFVRKTRENIRKRREEKDKPPAPDKGAS